MTLVDTCIWVDHLNRTDFLMAGLLEKNQVAMHALVAGEISMGSMRNRKKVLRELALLPQAPVAHDAEVGALIEKHRLHGTGLGYIDAHLLASALIMKEPLWTRDRRLQATAEKLRVAFPRFAN